VQRRAASVEPYTRWDHQRLSLRGFTWIKTLTLNVIVEGAAKIPVLLQQAESISVAEIFELQ